MTRWLSKVTVRSSISCQSIRWPLVCRCRLMPPMGERFEVQPASRTIPAHRYRALYRIATPSLSPGHAQTSVSCYLYLLGRFANEIRRRRRPYTSSSVRRSCLTRARAKTMPRRAKSLRTASSACRRGVLTRWRRDRRRHPHRGRGPAMPGSWRRGASHPGFSGRRRTSPAAVAEYRLARLALGTSRPFLTAYALTGLLAAAVAAWDGNGLALPPRPVAGTGRRPAETAEVGSDLRRDTRARGRGGAKTNSEPRCTFRTGQGASARGATTGCDRSRLRMAVSRAVRALESEPAMLGVDARGGRDGEAGYGEADLGAQCGTGQPQLWRWTGVAGRPSRVDGHRR